MYYGNKMRALLIITFIGTFSIVTAQNTVNKDKKVLTFKIRKGPSTTSTYEIYTIVDQMPSFPEGDRTLQQFLARTIQYPQKASEEGIQGTVYISFIVGENGVIRDAKVVRGVSGCKELEKEAMRVISLMPSWTPGRLQGRPVPVLFTLPIKFSLK